jgi:drug/metabolite transporter (DMT)-like permease
LLLNLEGVFTLVFAIFLFGEHGSPRLGLSALLIFAGAVLIGYRPGEAHADARGVISIAAACAAWGVDNNLTQRLSLKDPVNIVRWKALGAGLCNLVLAFAMGERLRVSPSLVAGCLLLGFLGYGLSIVLDVYALRLIGAAREAAFFAIAPFVGALLAVPLLGERLGRVDFFAGGLMAVGVMLLIREQHHHLHTHEPITHEHLHVHDDHHQHAHGTDWDGHQPHSHEHTHERIEHAHEHVPDAHHRHRH